MITAAEPLVGLDTALPVSISQVIRCRLSNARFNVSPAPNEAFIRAPNGEYGLVKEFAHGVDGPVGREKSVDG